MKLAFALALLPALAGVVDALTIEARVRAPRGFLMDGKLVQSGTLACRLLDACEKPVYRPDDASGFSGRVSIKGRGYRPELGGPERAALLKQLEDLWGEPVTILDGPAELGAGRSEPLFQDKLSKALPVLLPQGLTNGTAAGAFYDRSLEGSGFAVRPPAVTAGASAGGPGRPALAPAAPKDSAASQPPAVERDDAKPVPYAREIAAAAGRYHLEPGMLSAVVAAKSGYHARGGHGDSYGLMGLSERSFRVMEGPGQDIHDPQSNLDAGARILSGLLRQFDGDVHRALAAYQVGPRAVLRSGGIPNSREVRAFLAAYEAAYRSGRAKPVVEPVAPPSVTRRAKDTIQSAAVDALDHQRRAAAKAPAGTHGAARYRALIEAAAERAGADPLLMEAMVMRESEGDKDAVSRKGARGLGQLMPKTARLLGVKDPNDPAQNLRGMAKHLVYLTEKYEDPVLAVAAYNAGESRVERAGWLVPHIRETREYVRRVFENYYGLSGQRYDVESYMAPPPPRRRKAKKQP